MVGQHLLAADAFSQAAPGGQRVQQGQQIEVFAAQWLVVGFLQSLDLGAGQSIGLRLDHPEAPPAFDADAEQAVGLLLPVADQRLAADAVGAAPTSRPSRMATTPNPPPCFRQRPSKW